MNRTLSRVVFNTTFRAEPVIKWTGIIKWLSPFSCCFMCKLIKTFFHYSKPLISLISGGFRGQMGAIAPLHDENSALAPPF